VNAIAPKSDLTKTGRAQYATLFRVADTAKRGLVSWDDFVVFETILKRPDADYWIAFQYFDVYACLLRRCNVSLKSLMKG
jgi:solute carrier family 25 (mitochondrial aspartate/glutamate transporter), member 12/13